MAECSILLHLSKAPGVSWYYLCQKEKKNSKRKIKIQVINEKRTMNTLRRARKN